MARPTPAIKLPPEQGKLLHEIARAREVTRSLSQRAQIVLSAANGNDNKMIAKEMGLCEETVGLWRRRWIEASSTLGKTHNPKKLRAAVEEVLSDKQRPGSPGKFTAEQFCQVIAVACETPPEYISHWSRVELAREVIERDIVETI